MKVQSVFVRIHEERGLSGRRLFGWGGGLLLERFCQFFCLLDINAFFNFV